MYAKCRISIRFTYAQLAASVQVGILFNNLLYRAYTEMCTASPYFHKICARRLPASWKRIICAVIIKTRGKTTIHGVNPRLLAICQRGHNTAISVPTRCRRFRDVMHGFVDVQFCQSYQKLLEHLSKPSKTFDMFLGHLCCPSPSPFPAHLHGEFFLTL